MQAADERNFELQHQLEALHSASYAWALACSGYDRDEALEVIQSTYVKVLEGSARFEQRSSFKTWLFAVIRNTAASRRRRARLRRLALVDWFRAAPDPSPVVEQATHPDRDAIFAAIRMLPRRQSEVLELVFYHDLSLEESALTLGISVGSARVHYARGKRRLAQQLAQVLP